MKVCTDSCLFGAAVSKYYCNENIENLLDIGTGTGLLSLMLAQNNSTKKVTAVEIDESAYTQALENFTLSPFKQKIELHLSNIINFKSNLLFDVIICNPPFYENELNSQSNHKNIAMHSSMLLHQELLKKATSLLNNNGSFWVLLPFSYSEKFIKQAELENLFPQFKLAIKNNNLKTPFRIIIQFSKNNTNKTNLDELVIKDNNNNYTPQFIELLKPYYLYL